MTIQRYDLHHYDGYEESEMLKDDPESPTGSWVRYTDHLADKAAAIAEKDAEIEDWRESARKAAMEPCGGSNEVHCACAGPLRYQVVRQAQEIVELNEEIATLRAELDAKNAELASMRAPLWMLREEHEAEVANVRAELDAAREAAELEFDYVEPAHSYLDERIAAHTDVLGSEMPDYEL